ncbi:hypothetical protein TWF694_011755 [Orbilia ellipsospora]|uniref:Uncharacterized protein n=1 Tax=Orbilia ellipsospora TaxID=2528407 RepID=A0AAV9XCD5_9PEZI
MAGEKGRDIGDGEPQSKAPSPSDTEEWDFLHSEDNSVESESSLAVAELELGPGRRPLLSSSSELDSVGFLRRLPGSQSASESPTGHFLEAKFPPLKLSPPSDTTYPRDGSEGEPRSSTDEESSIYSSSVEDASERGILGRLTLSEAESGAFSDDEFSPGVHTRSSTHLREKVPSEFRYTDQDDSRKDPKHPVGTKTFRQVLKDFLVRKADPSTEQKFIEGGRIMMAAKRSPFISYGVLKLKQRLSRELLNPESSNNHRGIQNVGRALDTEEGFLEERTFKLQTIYLFLQLLFWREATRRIRRESPVSEPVLESEESSVALYCRPLTGISPGTISSRGASTKNTGTETLGTHQQTPIDKKRKGDQSDENDGDGERQHPRHKRTKKGSIRSLNGQLACPFAKADPNIHLNCLMIGRKDLSGVKEHVRRNHFTKSSTTPSELLAAKTWNAVFDFCNPEWSPRPRPSPYVDNVELSMNLFNWNTPQSQGNSNARDLQAYCRLPSNAHEPVVQSSEKASRNDSDLTATPEDNSNGHALQAQIKSANSTILPSSISRACTSCVPNILNAILTCSEPYAQKCFKSDCNCELSDFGLTPTLGAKIQSLAAPHLSSSTLGDLQQEIRNYPAFFNEEFGLDPTWSSEQLYSAAITNMDPAGRIFDASTGFLMPHFWYQTPSANFGAGIDLQTPEITPLPSDPDSRPNIPPIPFDMPLTPLPESNIPISTSPWIYSVPTIPNIQTSTHPIIDFTQSTTTQTVQIQYAKPSLPKLSEKYTLLVSRRPIDPTSTETQGYKRFYFEDFDDFRKYFELWMTVEFTDPLFSWDYMELYNDFRGARLQSVDDVVDDLEGSFTHYRSTKASLFLVKKDKGKGRAT